ncbi:SUMF1/EgtB/PvdO family nonheme iron enzyme [Maricurvus nonylphenolicus]|uniref:formylglycine-generating enzyme family protein n=1 Tax=Maricurvus nonylphenolicus TaxID=1008307 RepID=UPI0036F3FF9B
MKKTLISAQLFGAAMLVSLGSNAQIFDDSEMIHIPAGKFTMGCNHDDCVGDDVPAHKVKLKGFYIDKYEVTFRRYKLCVEKGDCSEPMIGGSCNWEYPAWHDDHPVNCVDFKQAESLCKSEGKRLPTEAEWEKAARGVDGRKFPWGSEPPTCDHVVMDPNGLEKPQPGCGRGTSQPVYHGEGTGDSPYGVVGMSGNMWEWTSDNYDPEYYKNSPKSNPTGPWIGYGLKTVRGGGFTMRTPAELTTTLRFGYSPEGEGYLLGIRCAMDE